MDRLQKGDIVKHFKYDDLSKENKDKNKYLYIILDIATHTETEEKLVVYQALYRDSCFGQDFGVYARPYEMFMGKVDKEKYPNVKQEYRFEKVDGYAIQEIL